MGARFPYRTKLDRGEAGKSLRRTQRRSAWLFRQVTKQSKTDAWSSTRSKESGIPMDVSTLRQAPRSDKLRTIDCRPVALEDDLHSLESAAARYVSTLLRRLFHRSIFQR